jgi:hypothetical protein
MAEASIYQYVPHDRTSEKLNRAARPVSVDEQLPKGTVINKFNSRLAVRVTKGVGTMWCAYAFAALALIGLPSAIRLHSPVGLVSWISQTFLQLVLLSVIIVGQNEMAAAADKRAEATHSDADAVLHEVVKLQEHLAAQDQVLSRLLTTANRAQSAPGQPLARDRHSLELREPAESADGHPSSRGRHSPGTSVR